MGSGPARDSQLFLPCLGCLQHFPRLIQGRAWRIQENNWRWISVGALSGRCSGSWDQAGRCLCPHGWIREVPLYPRLVAWQSSTAHWCLCASPAPAWLTLAGRESETLLPANKTLLQIKPCSIWHFETERKEKTPVKQRVRLSALVCVSVNPLQALRGQSWVAFI